MTYWEYREILEYELYRLTWEGKPSFWQRLRIKHFQPNTNCMYLARKMWFLYQKGGIFRCWAKWIYLRILRKFGCIIYPNAEVGKGFFISHPVGIVLGKCRIGKNFVLYQNCSIGVKKYGEEVIGAVPVIGNNVTLYSNSLIVGGITITDDVTIGALSVVSKDISEAGVYVGAPVRRRASN